MTRNYDVFFVFGKAKKLHQIKFFWGVGGLLRSQFVSKFGWPLRICALCNERLYYRKTVWLSHRSPYGLFTEDGPLCLSDDRIAMHTN
jgi:hypothetical protein